MHEAESKSHPSTLLSEIVKIPGSIKPENTYESVAVPSSTSVKLLRGNGDAVNGNSVLPSTLATFVITIEPVTCTAELLSERSILPLLQLLMFEHAKPLRRM